MQAPGNGYELIKVRLKSQRWRNLLPVGVIMAATFAALNVASAQDHGTLRAAIRTAGHACANVLEATPAGDASTWQVRCNSGSFVVTLDDSGTSKVVAVN